MMRLRATPILVWMLFGLAACKTSGFSALNSVNPVMLGPVHSLGGGKAPDGSPAQGFQSRSADHSDLILGISESNDKKTKTATVQGSSATSSPNQGDYDVLLATQGDPAQRISVGRIGCGGSDVNIFYVYYVADAWCETSGDIYAAAHPTAAAAAPSGPAAAATPAADATAAAAAPSAPAAAATPDAQATPPTTTPAPPLEAPPAAASSTTTATSEATTAAPSAPAAPSKAPADPAHAPPTTPAR